MMWHSPPPHLAALAVFCLYVIVNVNLLLELQSRYFCCHQLWLLFAMFSRNSSLRCSRHPSVKTNSACMKVASLASLFQSRWGVTWNREKYHFFFYNLKSRYVMECLVFCIRDGFSANWWVEYRLYAYRQVCTRVCRKLIFAANCKSKARCTEVRRLKWLDKMHCVMSVCRRWPGFCTQGSTVRQTVFLHLP